MTVVSANIATLDPKVERAAARAGLRQGQRAEELERMFDDAGADVIALQKHRLQTEMWWALPADILQRQPTRHARGCTLVLTKPFQAV